MGENMWAQICAQAKNHQSAWEKISGLKFQLTSRTISLHGRKLLRENFTSVHKICERPMNYYISVLPSTAVSARDLTDLAYKIIDLHGEEELQVDKYVRDMIPKAELDFNPIGI